MSERENSLVKAENQAPAVWVPPDPEAIGVSRRQFFNRATVSLMSVGLLSFAAAGFVAFLWPIAKGGFGGKVERRQARRHHRQHPLQRRLLLRPRGPRLDHRVPVERIAQGRGRLRAGRARLRSRPGSSPRTRSARTSAAACRSCASSQWFECPCHGSQYNRVGEKKAGPAPRGLDHFAFTVGASGDVVVDTGIIYPGPADRYEHHRPGSGRAALRMSSATQAHLGALHQ